MLMNLIFSKLLRNGSFLSILNFSLILYVLYSAGGYLTICEQETQTVYTTTVRTDLLPPSDLQRLHEGIICTDRAHLASVLENYIS